MPTIPAFPAIPSAAALATALSAALPAAPASAQDQRPTLTVYTYGSFVSEWGPGPAITEAFEAECDCTLDWVAVDDSVALLSRLRLEGSRTDADVVLGLDTNLMADAKRSGALAPHGLSPDALTLPVRWEDEVFLPFDWGWFAFIYDSETVTDPPGSLRDLVYGSDLEVVIQDPRTSTPGLGLLLWMRSVFGDEAAEAWAALDDRIVTVTSGWTEAYSLFLEGEAPMVLSYTTSPAYHMTVEDTDRYRAAAFAEGHYLQVEVAAMTAGTDQLDLARAFLAFMVDTGFQQAIPTGNWMYPVVDLPDGLPPAFDRLITPAESLLFEPETVAENRRAWIDDWLQALSR